MNILIKVKIKLKSKKSYSNIQNQRIPAAVMLEMCIGGVNVNLKQWLYKTTGL